MDKTNENNNELNCKKENATDYSSYVICNDCIHWQYFDGKNGVCSRTKVWTEYSDRCPCGKKE